LEGAATAIGERPITGIVCPDKMARMAVGEMVTNIMWVKTKGLNFIKCSGNWMWPAKKNTEKRKMLLCAKALRDVMCDLELSIDGGKDSLSMSSTTRVSNQRVDCPPQLVISGYTTVSDITKKVTPNLKTSGNSLLYINISEKYRLGGSTLVQTMNSDSGVSGLFPNDYPDLDAPLKLAKAFEAVQLLISKEMIVSGHDISDGGLITTVLEMAISGNKGMKLVIDTSEALCSDDRFIRYRWVSILFAEELGFVIEVPYSKLDKAKKCLSSRNVPYQYIGYVTNEDRIQIKLDGQPIIDKTVTEIRRLWEHTSFELEKLQSNPATVAQERDNLNVPPQTDSMYGFYCTEKVWQSLYRDNYQQVSLRNSFPNRPRIAVIREEGSNGDREMCACWWSAGFEPYDITTTDIIPEDSPIDLKNFNGIVFVGGFTFSDVFGAAKGWESIIRNNDRVRKQFDWFYSDQNTTRFSLGVCNGCQLMCRMGWVGKPFNGEDHVPVPYENESGRFESRFVKLKIVPNNSVLLSDMGGCSLGVWVAHGEGRFGDSTSTMNRGHNTYFPLRYINNHNTMYTDKYPHNPNGSVYGIAGAASKNGLHLAMMPHPERSTKSWQHPWYPRDWQPNVDATYDGASMPWSKMFKNGYDFVMNKN
jgi:phosphoribosylformylglycinamidine synthase